MWKCKTQPQGSRVGRLGTKGSTGSDPTEVLCGAKDAKRLVLYKNRKVLATKKQAGK